jgi:hypothetical protein
VLAVLVYVAACCLINRTRITFDGERLESRAGPLPFRPPRRIRLPDLSAVQCRVRMIHSRSGRYALHDLVAVRADGRTLRLVSDQPYPECTLFVRQEILKRLAARAGDPRAGGTIRNERRDPAVLVDDAAHAAMRPLRWVMRAIAAAARSVHVSLRLALVPELQAAGSARHARALMRRAYRAVSRARPVGRFLLFVPMSTGTVILLGAGMQQLSKIVPEPDSIWTGLPYGCAVVILLGIPSTVLIYAQYLLLFRPEIRATLSDHLSGDAARPCAKCGYDLRGQVERRCPECGTPMPARLCPLGEPAFPRTASIARG